MPDTSYEKAVAAALSAGEITPAESRAIEARLAEWHQASRSGTRITRNLKEERFLPPDSMRAVILLVRDSPMPALPEQYRSLCHSHKLKGGPVRNVSSSYFGIAMEKAQLLKGISDRYGGSTSSGSGGPSTGASHDTANDLLFRLKTGGNLFSFEKAFFLEKFMHWITWGVADPFEFVQHNVADEIRAHLGIDPRKRSDELVLMRFEAGPGVDPLRPTVTDANHAPFFRPPMGGFDDHGLTVPWPPGLPGDYPDDFEAEPRPEGVHQRISISSLRLPVESLG